MFLTALLRRALRGELYNPVFLILIKLSAKATVGALRGGLQYCSVGRGRTLDGCIEALIKLSVEVTVGTLWVDYESQLSATQQYSLLLLD